MSLEELGYLLLPADDPASGRIVRPDERWRFDPEAAGGAAVVVWGREPLPSGSDPAHAASVAAARERAIAGLRLRPPAGLHVAAVHRWAPPRLRGGGARNAARAAVLGGAVLELTAGPRPPRVVDAAAGAAAWPGAVGAVRAGSGGALLARTAGRLLRVGRGGGPADPGPNADALERLAANGLGPREGASVPSPIARGESAGASWSVESVLPGRRPRGVDEPLAAAVAAFAAVLPRGDGPASAHRGDLDALTTRLPERAHALARLRGRIDAAAADLPAVLRHGDLWAGNLLVDRAGLRGVVDWDAWHPSAIPGADLLHAVATQEGIRAGRGLGDEWRRRVWRGPAFDRAARPYWSALGLMPSADQLDAVGDAWWAGQAAATLRRVPELARDRDWVGRNVDAVLDHVGA